MLTIVFAFVSVPRMIHVYALTAPELPLDRQAQRVDEQGVLTNPSTMRREWAMLLCILLRAREHGVHCHQLRYALKDLSCQHRVLMATRCGYSSC
jgi:hypothetical protein